MYDYDKMRRIHRIDQKPTYVFKICSDDCGELATAATPAFKETKEF